MSSSFSSPPAPSETAYFVVTLAACSVGLTTRAEAQAVAYQWATRPGAGWYAIVSGPRFPGPSLAELARIRAVVRSVATSGADAGQVDASLN